MECRRRALSPVFVVSDEDNANVFAVRDEPMDFESGHGPLEELSFMHSTSYHSTRLFQASVPVTPPKQCRQIIEVATFPYCSSDDDTNAGGDLGVPDFSSDEDDDYDQSFYLDKCLGSQERSRFQNFFEPQNRIYRQVTNQDNDDDDLPCSVYNHEHSRGFHSDRRVQDLGQPLDPDSRQVAVTYYCALTKLATSMRLSEETRSGIMLQRRVLHDVYGHLDTNSSLLCGTGSGAASDYEVSRNALMSHICDAMEQHPPWYERRCSK
jgi:hypothetical protein